MNTVEAFDTPLPPAGRGLLIVPKHDEGDYRLEWEHERPDQVEAARQSFISLKAKGYKAYRIDPKDGKQGEIIKEFDAKAGKIVMVAPFAGG